MEKEYRVVWEIDVYAKSPERAAIQAEYYQRQQIEEGPRGTFTVTENQPNAKRSVVHLYDLTGWFDGDDYQEEGRG